jgi:hypothetical protein
MMPIPALAAPEAGSHLEDPFVARRQKAFHVKFRRRSQERIAGRLGVDMKLKRGRWNPDGGFDFQEPALVKEFADDA